jgi:hypothetical protein
MAPVWRCTAPRGVAAGCSRPQQLLDLPGNTLVLRMDRWRTAPPTFSPIVLTALVTAMSIALVTVMVVLVRDNRAGAARRA